MPSAQDLAEAVAAFTQGSPIDAKEEEVSL